MSQPRRSSQPLAPSQLSSGDGSAQVADAYAEKLIDELFEDVDHLLDHGMVPQTAVAERELLVNAPSHFELPFESSPAQSRSDSNLPVPLTSMLVPVPDQAVTQPSETSTPKPKGRSLPVWLPRLVLGAACLCAIAAVGFWLTKTQSQSSPGAATDLTPTADSVPESPAATNSNDAFGEYLTRSLSVLSGQTTAQTESASPLPASGNSSIPASSAATSGRPNIIERVFVPVFQPNPTVRPNLPAPQSGPVAAAPRTAPSPTAPTPRAASSAPAAATPNIAPASTHKLMGVLELGDRSAALFEINGVPQRVYVGETIGSSGWSVVSIASEEVVVRRNGEVRSVYIGQEF